MENRGPSPTLASGLSKNTMEHFLRSKRNLCICIESNGVIIGFVGLLSDRSELLRSFMAGDIIKIIAHGIARLSLLLDLLRRLHWWSNSFRFPATQGEASFEYRSAVVAQQFRGRGVASVLLAIAEEVIKNRGGMRVSESCSCSLRRLDCFYVYDVFNYYSLCYSVWSDPSVPR